jgi:hypothetical protein
MSPVLTLVAVTASVVLLFACGNSDPGVPAPARDTTGGGVDSGTPYNESGSPVGPGPQTDAGSPADGATTAPPDAGADAGDPTDAGVAPEAGAAVTLVVENYLSWCKVSVNGGASSTAATQTVTVAPDTVVNLSGDLASSFFVWGYWVGTAGDTTAAHDTSKTTTVKVSVNKKVQACCPLASAPNTPCPPPM